MSLQRSRHIVNARQCPRDRANGAHEFRGTHRRAVAASSLPLTSGHRHQEAPLRIDSAIAIIVTLVLGTVFGSTAAHAQGSEAAKAKARHAFTFDSSVALWTVAVKPDKTRDFERVLARLRDGLQRSQQPERRTQAAGWKVLRLNTPLPDGNVAYVHLVDPVVPGADYTVMQVLYEEFPDERQALYELYRGAFAANLSLALGAQVIDMSTTATH